MYLGDETDSYVPKYDIWYECGCKTTYAESIKRRVSVVSYKTVSSTNLSFCPNHPEISKKIRVIFYCSDCGAAVEKTTEGNPLSKCYEKKRFCNDCYRKHAALRNKKYREDIITGKKQHKREPHPRLKIDYIKTPRKHDCRYYDYCVSKAGIEDTDLDCRGCSRYESKPLDINEYAESCNSGTSDSIYHVFPNKGDKDIKKMLKAIAKIERRTQKIKNVGWKAFSERNKKRQERKKSREGATAL